jgi:hypothetical protein
MLQLPKNKFVVATSKKTLQTFLRLCKDQGNPAGRKMKFLIKASLLTTSFLPLQLFNFANFF